MNNKLPVRVLVQLENLHGKKQGVLETRQYTDPFNCPPGSFHKDNQTNSKIFTPLKIVNKVRKVNETTVSVVMAPNLIKYSNLDSLIFFDVVGTEYDHSVQNEYGRMSSILFQDNRDCALIEIKAHRLRCPIRKLGKVLVSNVITQLMFLPNFELQSIELEYCDLRKYEVVDMLGPKKGFTNVKNTVQFASILVLLKWLHTDFQRYWHKATNNDVLDVQYTLVNNIGEVQQYKLSIIYLYLSKMDIWTRIELDDILRNVHVKSNLVEKRQTILSDCLREYFHKKSTWNVWICFRIPTYLYTSTNIVYDMLKMADGVYKKTHDFQSDTTVNGHSNSISLEPIASVVSENAELSNSESRLSSGNNKQGLIKENTVKERSTTKFLCFKNNSSDRLKDWYQKIDKQTKCVLKILREYYMYLIESSLKEVNQDAHDFPPLISKYFQKRVDRTPETVDRSSEIKHLHYLKEKFKHVFEGFNKIKEQCTTSNKRYLISEYYNKKKEQIVQEERKLLRMFIRNCHQNLCTSLKGQLQLLSLKSNIWRDEN